MLDVPATIVQAWVMSALLDALGAAEPAIEEVALAIADDEYPGLDRGRYLAMIDRHAAEIAPRVALARDAVARVAVLTHHIYVTHGFRGNSEDYYDPRNSYLHVVLERRLGIPISLAVVLMAVGRKLGLTVEGIGFPGHFLVRAGGPSGVYLDPFSGGRVLERDELLHLARRFFGDNRSLAEGQLQPVDAKAMAIRMLYNLQQIYERRGDHARALVVCDRLVDVATEPFHRRDRGIHALALGAGVVAARDFEAYLARVPSGSDNEKIRGLLEKARRQAGTLH